MISVFATWVKATCKLLLCADAVYLTDIALITKLLSHCSRRALERSCKCISHAKASENFSTMRILFVMDLRMPEHLSRERIAAGLPYYLSLC